MVTWEAEGLLTLGAPCWGLPSTQRAIPECFSSTWVSGPRSLTFSFLSCAPHLSPPSSVTLPSLHTPVSPCLAAVPSFTPLVPPAAVAVPRVAEPHGLGVPKHTHPVPPVATAA